MALAEATDRRDCRTSRQCVSSRWVSSKRVTRRNAGRSRRRLAAGMAAADHDDIPGVGHRTASSIGVVLYGRLTAVLTASPTIALFHVKQTTAAPYFPNAEGGEHPVQDMSSTPIRSGDPLDRAYKPAADPRPRRSAFAQRERVRDHGRVAEGLCLTVRRSR